MKKFLKFLLITGIWVAIAALAVAGAVMLGYSPLAGLQLAGVLLALWLLFLGVRKLIRRQRAKRRTERLVNVAEPEGSGEAPGESGAGSPLPERFRSVVRFLRKSDLRRKGDPLYVLPWYLLLGRPASGKTSVLHQARLPIPSLDQSAFSSGGRSCDWWLYHQAIVMDTPGEYYEKEKPGPSTEWRRLLQGLGRYRSREPINGVVVTVSAQRLVEADLEELFEEGQQNRKRVDEAMERLGVRVPVYVLVTQSDRLEGFAEWVRTVPREERFQAMGYGCSDQSDPRQFALDAVRSIGERVKDLMMPALHQGQASPELVRFPSRLQELGRPLRGFLDGLFQADVYQETPLIRGLYFAGPDCEEREEADRDVAGTGVFSHQFFTEILPGDRDAVRDLASAQRSRGRYQRAWAAVLTLVATVAFVGMGVSYYTHKASLEGLQQRYSGELVRPGTLSERVGVLMKMRSMARELQVETAATWIPWHNALGPAPTVGKLKNIFTARFRSDLLEPVDKRFNAEMEALSPGSGAGSDSEPGLSDFLLSLVFRLNVLNARLDGMGERGLGGLPEPFARPALFFPEEMSAERVAQFNDLYRTRVAWIQDREVLMSERDRLQEMLLGLLREESDNLDWVVSWANSMLPEQGVGLKDFWQGSGRAPGGIGVPPAFTLAGRERIQGFLGQLEDVAPDSEVIRQLVKRFRGSYRERYLAAWRRFAADFQQGARTLQTREEWIFSLQNLATPRNKYFQLLDRMNAQLAPVLGNEAPPAWARLVTYYQDVSTFAPAQESGGGNSKVLSKLGLKVMKKLGAKKLAKTGKKAMKTQRKLDKGGSEGPSDRVKALEEAGKLLDKYRKAMKEIVVNAEVRSVSLKAMKGYFNDPHAVGQGKGPLSQAVSAVKEMQQFAGLPNRDNRAFWKIYNGPVTLAKRFMKREAGCVLQQRWTDRFLAALEGVPEYKLPKMIYGEGGELWKFLDGELAPFVKKQYRAGYVPVKAEGLKIPFREEFLAFLSRGWDTSQARRDAYKVKLQALPTDANSGAAYPPGKTVTELQCPTATQRLVNYNFPAEKTFKWSPDCGDALIAMQINGLRVEHRFEGPKGFLELLKTFRSGAHRFTPADFPEHRKELRDMGVKYLQVRFRMDGHKAALASQDKATLTPPTNIVGCWSQA
ncbi:type VI secretion protein IcmF/TssM N-terminal domain-containing protein [Thiohalorhabdus sp. Cl-TMA]|uniref:Type VI secretion protein IcmF/TssM N-terminal domain-containing protein n=1 Tax=Thiohalorhabdus methylotrophus TaxID=3242694 RepID=A0ABV4TSF6_9GAMM